MMTGTLTEISANFDNIFCALAADFCSALAETILSQTVGLYFRCSSPNAGR